MVVANVAWRIERVDLSMLSSFATATDEFSIHLRAKFRAIIILTSNLLAWSAYPGGIQFCRNWTSILPPPSGTLSYEINFKTCMKEAVWSSLCCVHLYVLVDVFDKLYLRTPCLLSLLSLSLRKCVHVCVCVGGALSEYEHASIHQTLSIR